MRAARLAAYSSIAVPQRFLVEIRVTIVEIPIDERETHGLVEGVDVVC